MSDDYFDDDSFALDDAAWRQIDALSSAAPQARAAATGPAARAAAIARSSAGSRSAPGPGQPSAATAFGRNGCGAVGGQLRQTTLFGTYAPPPPPPQPQAGPSSRAAVIDHTGLRPLDTHDGSGSHGMVRKTGKTWDRATAARQAAKAAKGKGRGRPGWDDEDEDEAGNGADDDGEDGSFDQFPAPAIALGELPAEMKHALDVEAAQTWVYPVNLPLRDYQFNIVRAALFRNTLAALPTGLGKTFIAGCVMLNYARWYPTAKIFFVAPTKPLVNQQAQAFPETCGFLNSKITVLNGDTSGDKREQLYPTKQVFFMTAQTMMNDLSNGRLDPRDVVLLVVDEAHKATGNHAYVQVIRYLQAHNHLFRILALTATPSGKPEGVQLLIDRLHLSHIEIRDEESIDLRQYVHKKTTELVLVRMTPNVLELKDLLEKLMRPLMEQLVSAGIFNSYERDPTRLHSYRCLSLGNQLQRQRNYKHVGALKKLEGYARAMQYLLEHSISMFQTALAKMETKKDSAVSKNKELRAIDATVERFKTQGGYVPHAKMDRLKGLLLEHFAPREPGDGRGDLDPETTRVMVFCSYRACLEEVVVMLNEERPLLKAVSFVGQSTDAEGRKGLKQSEQIQVIKEFKAGKFNVMVATSIGEEGLDIGSVDKIICYDASKSSVRMLQRVGRTGRKREGSIFVLMGEGREEDAWNKAKDNYISVQEAITKGAHLELYDDVPRLLPPDIKPTCVQEVVPIDQTVPDFLKEAKATATRKTSGGKQTKLTTSLTKVASGKHGAEVPDGTVAGFVFARDLTKRRVKGTDSDLEDDSDDEAISRGIQLTKPKSTAIGLARSTSASKAALGPSKPKARSKGTTLPDSSSSADDVPLPPPAKRARTELVRVPAASRPTRIVDRPQVMPAALPPQPRGPIEILDDDDDDVVMALDPSLYRIKAPDPNSFRAASGPIRHRAISSSRTLLSTSVGSRKQPTAAAQQQIALPARRPTPSFSPSPPPIRSSQKVQLSRSPEAMQAPAPVAVIAHLPADVAAQAGFDEIDPSWILDDDGDDGGYDTSFVPSPVAGPASTRQGHASGPYRPTSLQHEITVDEPATPAPAPRLTKEPVRLAPRMASAIGRLSNEEGQDLSWVLEDDESDSLDSPPVQSAAKRARPNVIVAGSSPDQIEMPPPASTRRLASTPGTNGHGHLESPFLPTQPVRRPGFRPKLRAAVLSSPANSPELNGSAGGGASRRPMAASPAMACGGALAPPLSAGVEPSRRLFEPATMAGGTARRLKDPSWYRGAVPVDVHRYFDKTAGDDRADRRRPSGRDDASSGRSSGTISDDGSAVDDEETSSDRAFAGEFQPTQAPRGYDQQRAYMRSVLSPRDGSSGRFSVARPGGGRDSDAAGARQGARPLRRFDRVASEGPDVDGGAEDDDWEYGTFVVDDEEPLMYDRSSEADEWMRK